MQTKPKGRLRKMPRNVAKLLLIVFIFLLGVNVGNGRIDLQRHSSVNGSLPNRLDYSGVDQLYRSIKDNYDGKLSAQQLQDGLKHGLATATKDPYTVYFTPKEAKDFSDQLNNSFSGIGAELELDTDGNLEVIAPIDGFPAAKAGLKAKDIIAAVNGTSTSGMSVKEAVSKIRGPKGSQVKLQIVRNHTETLDITITRQDINLPSVKSKTLDGNIGYLQITSFSPDTVGLAQKAAEQFKGQNVNGIILDMRNDPGGRLDASIRVSSLWLPSGQKVLDEKKGTKIRDSSTAVGGNILTGIPTVVLINSGSASASEIVAGALHDNKAAYLIGEKTYGKGVVQELVNFGDGSQLKVTVASWYRPNGQNINHKGVTPDKIVKISDADAKAGSDTQLLAAQAYLADKQ